MSTLDVFCNFALIAIESNYVKPEITNDLTFAIEGGRHPTIEKIKPDSFVKNNSDLSIDSRIWLITGPNMAGKSTFLRQNALIAIMAQIGCFVPADKAVIGAVDKIFSRIGSGDDLAKGQSTFMVEMLETSSILAQSTEKSLIILDEVGRGTSTYDGVAIAWSILEHIHNIIKCRCLFATHYHELTDMANFLPALKNYTVTIEETNNEILFLHNILQGVTDKSYGVHVAKLAGLHPSVIDRANEILLKFETKDIKKDNKEQLVREIAIDDATKSKIINYDILINELKKIDPDKLTPREALEAIYQLKQVKLN